MFIPVNAFNPVATIAIFFKNKGATSPENAISLSLSNWAEAGVIGDPLRFSTHPYKRFLKKTNDGKIWFSEQGFEEFVKIQERNTRLLLFFAFGFIIFGFTITILGYLFFNW